MGYSLEMLKEFYRTMLRIRLAEEGFVAPILDGTIKCPVHLCSGEEAIATGVCSALQKEDYVFGNHRSHGHYLAKGGDLKAMVAEVYCRETGCSRGRGGSMHLIDPDVGMLGSAPIVAGTISLALGAALAASIRDDGRVAVSFFGDGATGEGVLCESLNFAALKKLPIIFVCENNLYSTHLPIDEIRVNRQIYQLGKPFGEKCYRVDGNDVIKVYEKAQHAVELCRNGEGPVLLECMTYRQRGHVGPDDNVQGTHTDIRPPAELARWMKKDPIKKLEKYLRNEMSTSVQELEKLKKSVEREVAEAFDAARASAFPDPMEVARYVYAD
ncbi:thiamine pyrophosphate-dependent dehydrogenase E1 component subunit alpha [Trichlorobacter ammonificans]|uniref:Pyruvate dehydrogenase complex, dehydrogenase (E1) component, alpha subunit n=1 Tax=Trichlorobacter ammonificans TaxID=2916410 RepID=A0ABM9DCZ4_9BACT|nr:thiamine pyrophosphate-dependent dehydrogenase E1 component subunit alpha [Trichlorobacter ammonificans]CAH2032333.1 Pyruvate dehydrogenase complex, dehydrogenase (E1) component, alpha subunit [Trichlorobacter ammonificans]